MSQPTDVSRALADSYSAGNLSYGELSSGAKELLIAESSDPDYTRHMFGMSDAGAKEDQAYYDSQQEAWEDQIADDAEVAAYYGDEASL